MPLQHPLAEPQLTPSGLVARGEQTRSPSLEDFSTSFDDSGPMFGDFS